MSHYAIKSNTGKAFRRSGVTFLPDRYTYVENPTDDQLSETALKVTKVHGKDDPIFEGVEPEVVTDDDPDLVAGREAIEEREELKRKAEEQLGLHQATITEKDGQIKELTAKHLAEQRRADKAVADLEAFKTKTAEAEAKRLKAEAEAKEKAKAAS